MDNQQQTGLTVADLMFVKQILEVVTKRGVFNAEELTTVGAFYDKLAGFLSATEAAAQAQAPADATPTDAPADETAPAEGE